MSVIFFNALPELARQNMNDLTCNVGSDFVLAESSGPLRLDHRGRDSVNPNLWGQCLRETFGSMNCGRLCYRVCLCE